MGRGLFYTTGTQWVELPTWAYFFIDLGYHVVSEGPVGDRRLVVGLALPTRSFAAALCSGGIVVARAESTDESDQCEAHFAWLAARPPGTLVSLRRGTRRFRGIYEEVETDGDGRLRLRIRVQDRTAGALTYLIAAHEALDVNLDSSSAPDRLPTNPTGRQIDVPVKFLKRWLGGIDPYTFAATTQHDCVILGKVRHLFDEAVQIVFGASDGKDVAEGTLQDLLRIRRFLPPGEPYRTEVIPANVKVDSPAEARRPPVVVFDGADGFLKWRDFWGNSHWIVLLDRSEPRFEEAVAQLNRSYSFRLESTPPALGKPPVGVELMAFWEGN